MKITQIEYLRKREKMSQEQLADKLEISRQTISEWERGITYPSVEKLIELTKIFNVSLDFLVFGKIFKEKNLNEDNFLHYAKWQNTKNYCIGKKNGLIASIPQDTHIGNTLVVGGAGSGKTRGYLIPNILKAIERNENIVLIDHLGEIKEVLNDKIQDSGYTVYNLDFHNPKESTTINMSKALFYQENLSNKYIEILYKSLFNHKHKNPLHFSLFKFLISEKIKDKSFDILNPSKNDIMTKLYDNAPYNIEFKYLQSHQIEDYLYGLLFELNNIFNNPDITNIIFNGELELKDLLKPKTIVFINPDFFNVENTKILSAILNLLFTKIILKEIKIDNKINMFLDEYSQLSNYFNLIDNISHLNKNITISILVQSLSQLNCDKNNLLNNFRNFIYMGSFNFEDMETLANFFELPIENLRDLKSELIYKREFNKAIFLDKILELI